MKPANRGILVVGAGWVGRRHIEALQGVGAGNIGLCEPHLARRHEAAQLHALTAAYATLDEALRDPWEAAVVASPAHTHVAIGRAFTERGIPVLVEKPVAVTAEGVEEWQALAEARGAPVMVGFVYRCHPLLVAVREELLAGRIGRPVQLVAHRGAHLPARRADYRDSYYARREQGGGVVHDILSHLYNAAEWLVGPIDRVAADAAHQCLPGVEVDDTIHAIARHGYVLATYAVNQFQPAAEFTLTVHGTCGSLRAAFHENRWESADQPDAGWTPHPIPPLSPVEWFVRQARTFLAVAQGRQAPPCSLPEGIATLHAVLATLRAATQQSGWVPVTPHAVQPV